MINAATIDYIDISRTYFEEEYVRETVRWYFFDIESDGEINMNKVISKPYARKKAICHFEKRKTEFAELYMSVDAMKVKEIKDYLGQKVFQEVDEDLSGWVFLYDAIPFANWDHPCKYLLVIDDENWVEIDYDKGLSDRVRIEQVCVEEEPQMKCNIDGEVRL